VNQQTHTGIMFTFYQCAMLHYNSVNIPSIQNMEHSKKNCTTISVYSI